MVKFWEICWLYRDAEPDIKIKLYNTTTANNSPWVIQMSQLKTYSYFQWRPLLHGLMVKSGWKQEDSGLMVVALRASSCSCHESYGLKGGLGGSESTDLSGLLIILTITECCIIVFRSIIKEMLTLTRLSGHMNAKVELQSWREQQHQTQHQNPS